ncbi:MAG: DUF6512 family protein [Acutalibacteraceae bacterium]
MAEKALKQKKHLKWAEFAGVFFTFGVGTVLHFVFEWSGGAVWSVLFGAVNESVWEHIKIFTIPYLAWSFIELAAARPPFKMFVISKTVGIYSLGLAEILFFYLYTAFTGKAVLWVDILSVFVFIALAHVLSYKITYLQRDFRVWFPLAAVLLFLYFCMFFWFTVSPPKAELFKDPVTGTFGLPAYAKNVLLLFGGIINT